MLPQDDSPQLEAKTALQEKVGDLECIDEYVAELWVDHKAQLPGVELWDQMCCALLHGPRDGLVLLRCPVQQLLNFRVS